MIGPPHLFFGAHLTGGGLAAAVEWYGYVLSECRFRLWVSEENDQSSHFALTGPGFAVGTSVSYSRMLGGATFSLNENHPLDCK